MGAKGNGISHISEIAIAVPLEVKNIGGGLVCRHFFAAAKMAHLSDDETVAKMGHGGFKVDQYAIVALTQFESMLRTALAEQGVRNFDNFDYACTDFYSLGNNFGKMAFFYR